ELGDEVVDGFAGSRAGLRQRRRSAAAVVDLPVLENADRGGKLGRKLADGAFFDLDGVRHGVSLGTAATKRYDRCHADREVVARLFTSPANVTSHAASAM